MAPQWQTGGVDGMLLAMAVANLVLSYLKALVWPLVVLILSAVFRRELRGLFGRVSSVDAAGTSVKFSEAVIETSRALVEVREESKTVRIRRPLPSVAAAARRVLDGYAVWPQVEHSVFTPPAETLREVFLVVAGVVNSTVDAFFSKTADVPDGAKARDVLILLDQLSLLTGIPGWKEAAGAVRLVLLHADGRKDGMSPPSRMAQFGSILFTGSSAAYRPMRAQDVDTVVGLANSTMQTIQELLEATELAHGGGTHARAPELVEGNEHS